jgi:transposase
MPKRNHPSKKRANQKAAKQSQPKKVNRPTVIQQANQLTVIRTDVAGIDVGAKELFVCAPGPEAGLTQVKVFGTTTPELMKVAEWLKEWKVTSVAMESTGVYWIAPFEVLESEGLEVKLTDTRQLSRVPGRKTDMLDCQWIQCLHSHGLLKGCFRPEESIVELRSVVRGKAVLVRERADWMRRIQKSLDQMNVRVHRAVTELDGVTGMKMVRAIVKGERDPRQLAKLRDPGCQKSEESMIEELTGHWREDHLFNLGQAMKMYDSIEERIGDYEKEILRQMEGLKCERAKDREVPPVRKRAKAKSIQRRQQEPARRALFGMTGVDATDIDGVGVEVMEAVVSEYGPDLKAFPNEKLFVAHLRLAPHLNITGGKPSKKKHPGESTTRVGEILRTAAISLEQTQTELGAYFRNIARHKERGVAVFATARKLAVLIYRALRWGQPYVDRGAAAYEERSMEIRMKNLARNAAQLGYELVPKTAATTAV